MGADEAYGIAQESLQVSLTAGTTYFIIVDGYDATEFGTFDLSVDQVTVPTNDTCGTATVVGALPWNTSGDTTFATSDYSFSSGTCPGKSGSAGSGARDVAYSFTPSTTGKYHIGLSNQSFDSTLYLVTDCADEDNTCLGANDTSSSENLLVDLTAGTTYYIIVDGYDSYEYGSFDLVVETVTPPANDTCAGATVVTSVPYTDAGATTFASGDYGYSSNSCPGNTSKAGNGSGDVVYAFTPSTTGSYTVSVSGFDATLYIATDCGNIDSTCVAGVDDCGTSCTETITTSLTAGTTYYIFVDGWSNTSNTTGSYTLDITSP